MLLSLRKNFLALGAACLLVVVVALISSWVTSRGPKPELLQLRAKIGLLNLHDPSTLDPLLEEILKADGNRRKLIETALVEGLRTHRDPRVRSGCAHFLRQRTEKTVAALCAALENDPDPKVRASAALALGDAGGEQQVALLWRAVQDNKDGSGALGRVGVAAVRAIGEIGGEAAVGFLMRLWHDATLPEASKGIVVMAMGYTGDLRCLEAMQEALWSPESGHDLRVYASSALVQTLATSGSPTKHALLRPTFLRCLTDQVRYVRMDGVVGLEGCGEPEDIPRLQELLGREGRADDQPTIRCAIQQIEERSRRVEKTP